MRERYCLSGVRDEELMRELPALVRRGNGLTSEVLAHLAELDERGLHLDLGYPSLFAYCIEALGMSESAAGRRIAAARVCRKYPAAFERVATGDLHLSALCALTAYLSPENAEALFEACAHKSRRQIDELLAARFPKPDVQERIRRLSGRSPEALSAGRFGFHFTGGGRLKEKLEHARSLARHRLPNGDLAALIELAVDALIRDLEKARFAVGRKPREARVAQSPSPGGSTTDKGGASVVRKRVRSASADVARQVYQRDRGCCSFTSKNGRRCGSREFIELDHAQPWAVGGNSTFANLRLRCRAHNQRAARRYFGSAFVDTVARTDQRSAKSSLRCSSRCCGSSA